MSGVSPGPARPWWTEPGLTNVTVFGGKEPFCTEAADSAFDFRDPDALDSVVRFGREWRVSTPIVMFSFAGRGFRDLGEYDGPFFATIPWRNRRRQEWILYQIRDVSASLNRFVREIKRCTAGQCLPLRLRIVPPDDQVSTHTVPSLAASESSACSDTVPTRRWNRSELYPVIRRWPKPCVGCNRRQ